MSFAQGAPTQPLSLVASNVFLTGSSAAGNAFTIQQLSAGNVFSAQTSTGSTALIINPSGSVGIGTTNPGYNLDVGQFGASPYTLRVASASTTAGTTGASIRLMEAADSYGFSIQNISASRLGIFRHSASVAGSEIISIMRDNPYVGIGTASPGALFSVYGTTTQNSAIAYLTDSVYGSVNFVFNSSAGAYNSLTTAGDAIVWFTKGSVNTGCLTLAPHNSGSIGIRIASTSNTFQAGANTFSFVSNTSGTAMMTILGSGNVGIGTTSPSYTLDISYPGGVANQAQPFLRLGNPTGGVSATCGIHLMPWSSRSGGPSSSIIAIDDGNASAHLLFYTAAAGAATTQAERMRIQNNGYITYGSTYKYNLFYAPPNWSYATSTVNQWVSLWSFSFSLSVASYVDIGASGHWLNSVTGNSVYIGIGVDGNAPAATSSYFDNYTLGSASTYGAGIGGTFFDTNASSAWWQGYTHTTRVKLGAGSHTAALWCYGYSGTYTFNGGGMSLLVTPINYL